MMATSFRQFARSGPAATCLSSRPSTPTIRASTAASYTTRGHQRRHSSSKPPVPPNHGSSNIPAASEGSPKTVTPKSKAVSEKRAGAESRLSKRKTKDQGVAGAPVKDGVQLNIPMVPPTPHLQPRDVHLASLFSTHRPISIHSSIPRNIEDESFASIFAPKTKKSRNGPSDVIYTLSSAVKALDNVIQHQQGEGRSTVQSSNQQENASHMRNEILQQQGTPQHQQQADLQPQIRYFKDLKSAIDELAKEWRPFNPPPAPVSMSEEQIAAAEKATQEASSSSSLFNQTSENTDENLDDPYIQELIIVKSSPDSSDGSIQTEFFTSQFSSYNNDTTPSSHPYQQNISEPQQPTTATQTQLPSSSPSGTSSQKPMMRRKRGRIGIRQPSRTRQIIHAISVKRQRKLKMKKHKYKKLMRRTRNLRRKLDQL